jgi:hypothetical protein
LSFLNPFNHLADPLGKKNTATPDAYQHQITGAIVLLNNFMHQPD